MCVIQYILDARLVGEPVKVTQEEGHTGFLHLPSVMLALIFIARRIRPSLSLVDCEVEYCIVTHIARVWINRVMLPTLHVVS